MTSVRPFDGRAAAAHHRCVARRVALLPLATVLAVLVLALPAAAHGIATLSATPNPVRSTGTLTIVGHRWPVIEFCSRNVRLTLVSPRRTVPITTLRVGVHGGFRFHWRLRGSNVAPGRWRVVARMRCESGRTGRPVPLVRRVPQRVV